MRAIDPRRVKITTEPVAEPIDLAEAKLHCRVDADDEDALFARLIYMARVQCEQVARRSFITRTYTAMLDYWPYMTRFELPYPPLVSVTHIKYYDEDGVEATFNAANYVVDAHSEPGRIALKSSSSWPSVTLREINGVEIRWVAGYGNNLDDVPDTYRAAMLLLIAHLYEHRESVVVEQGVSLAELPMAFYDLLMTDRGGF